MRPIRAIGPQRVGHVGCGIRCSLLCIVRVLWHVLLVLRMPVYSFELIVTCFYFLVCCTACDSSERGVETRLEPRRTSVSLHSREAEPERRAKPMEVRCAGHVWRLACLALGPLGGRPPPYRDLLHKVSKYFN